MEAIPEAIHNVLDWQNRLVSALETHQHTKAYQDAVRKSGFAHGKSGLAATEQETRTAKVRHAHCGKLRQAMERKNIDCK